VVPVETEAIDITIKARILESSGDTLKLSVTVQDSRNKVWFKKIYKGRVTAGAYKEENLKEGETGPYQNVYNEIANDMIRLRKGMTPASIEQVHQTSQLRYAADFAPEVFGEHISTKGNGEIVINRLPSADDPMMQRLMKIREREYLYVDVLNEHYDIFYTDMWKPYEKWRRYNQVELEALREVQRSANRQKAIGFAMLLAAIALEVGDVDNISAVRDILIFGGTQVVVGGFNVSQQANMHAAALGELGDSFGAEMRPVVMQVEGRVVELSGTAEEQYTKWKGILRKMHYEETGFNSDVPDVPGVPDVSGVPGGEGGS
jgi:hypothetical protein